MDDAREATTFASEVPTREEARRACVRTVSWTSPDRFTAAAAQVMTNGTSSLSRHAAIVLLALIANACSAQVPAAPPSPVAADSVAACPELCELIECAPANPEPVIGLDAMLALLRPPHPVGAEGAEGTVFVQFIIRVEGSSDSFEIVRSMSPALDSAAVDVVRSIAWRPRDFDACFGEPYPVRYTLPVRWVRRPKE